MTITVLLTHTPQTTEVLLKASDNLFQLALPLNATKEPLPMDGMCLLWLMRSMELRETSRSLDLFHLALPLNARKIPLPMDGRFQPTPLMSLVLIAFIDLTRDNLSLLATLPVARLPPPPLDSMYLLCPQKSMETTVSTLMVPTIT